MSADRNRLRLEALRLRAAIEREELAGAVGEVRERTVHLRRIARAANHLTSAVAGSAGGGRRWIPLALAALEQRPWVGLALAGVIRLARHKPLAAALAVGALIVVARAAKAKGDQNNLGRDQGDPDQGEHAS